MRRPFIHHLLVTLFFVPVLFVAACDSTCSKPKASVVAPGSAAPGKSADGWISLFDGKTLGQWKSTQFGGEGEVALDGGAINLAMGAAMTGVTWQGEPPAKMNYEIELMAKRTEGHDFFCGLTFPYGDSPCTLVVGGWGGTLVGLSSLDNEDASNNETSTMVSFENDHWYKIRVRVTKEKIQAFIDDKLTVDGEIRGRKVSVRPEVELSKPLGIATWNTAAAIKDIKVRKF